MAEAAVRVQGGRLVTSEDDKVDRISVLPDETLGLVLSFLTLKEAVRTSTLSRQWRNTWTLTRKLDLDGTAILKEIKKLKKSPSSHKASVLNEERCRYLRWFDRLIMALTLHDHHHKSAISIDEFRVLFDLSSSHKQWIDDWLSYAVTQKLKTLELNLVNASFIEDRGSNRHLCYEFPYKEGNFPSNLKALKELSLHLVNVSGVTVELFLRNCPSLERVSVSRSLDLVSVEIIETFPSFKCLEISSCENLTSVVIRGSKVACIKFGGDSIQRFELINVPHLSIGFNHTYLIASKLSLPCFLLCFHN